MVINVYSRNVKCDNPSRREMLNWVNDRLKSDFQKIEELCTGAGYCQLMDLMFPGSIPMRRVRFDTNLDHEFMQNFKLLQAAFVKLSVKKIIPINELIKGRFQENLEFVQWFHRFFKANYLTERDYDPLAARDGISIGLGPSMTAPHTRSKDRSISTRTRVEDIPLNVKRFGLAAGTEKSLRSRTVLRSDASSKAQSQRTTSSIGVRNSSVATRRTSDAARTKSVVERKTQTPQRTKSTCAPSIAPRVTKTIARTTTTAQTTTVQKNTVATTPSGAGGRTKSLSERTAAGNSKLINAGNSTATRSKSLAVPSKTGSAAKTGRQSKLAHPSRGFDKILLLIATEKFIENTSEPSFDYDEMQSSSESSKSISDENDEDIDETKVLEQLKLDYEYLQNSVAVKGEEWKRYLDTLQQIETACQDHECDCKMVPFIERIYSVLYSVQDGFAIPQEKDDENNTENKSESHP